MPYWDWDSPRTREGYYRYQGGTQCAINRAIAFAPYADLLWMETKKPILSQAQEFAAGVHAARPGHWLAYNLSPSFNWDAAGLGEKDMESFVWQLGKLGFVWQFITVSRTVRVFCYVTHVWFAARWLALQRVHIRLVRAELCQDRYESVRRDRTTQGEGTRVPMFSLTKRYIFLVSKLEI